MSQICECYKKLKYLDSQFNVENSEELEEQGESFCDNRSLLGQPENAVRLPGILHINDSVTEYPDAQSSDLPTLFQEMARIIQDVNDYEVNILSFWIIDVFLEGLRTAQMAQMSQRNQKATLHWIAYLYNVIQGSGSKVTRKDVFLKVKFFLLASDEDEDYSEEKNESKVWKVPFPPVWRPTSFIQQDLDQTSSEKKNSAESVVTDSADVDNVDKNVQDMEIILEILYRIFARLWTFTLVQLSVRSTPKVETVDLPFILNIPKQVLKYENHFHNKSDRTGKKAMSQKYSGNATARKESMESTYILPLQAAEGVDVFLRDLFALPFQESSITEREKLKPEKKKK